MRFSILVTAVCAVMVSGQAEAFCGDATATCSQAFTGNQNSQPDGSITPWQKFDAQTGDQWSGASTKFGNFSMYSGVSQGRDWNNPQARYGNGASLNSQGQSSEGYCALYGSCR